MLTGPLGDVFAEMPVEEYERTSRGVVLRPITVTKMVGLKRKKASCKI